MSFVRLWLLGTAAVLAAIAVWAFAPVIVFLLLLTAALGVLSAAMIAVARGLQYWRDGRPRR